MQHFFKVLTLSAVGLALAGTAHAAGYQLNEYSAAGMGRSFAGMGVVGDDFSAIGYNPAGMSLNKTNGAQIGGSVVRITSNFRGEASEGNPATYGKGRTTVTVGLGIYTPYGLATDYPRGWFAERHGGLSQINLFDVSPALSYRFNKYFSVGASVNVQRAEAHLTSSGADLRGDDWGTGYSVGMTIRPLEQLRFGLSYRSKVAHQLKGKLKGRGSMASLQGYDNAAITTPETAVLSGAWDVNERWTLSGTARWTRWKRFNVLNIQLGPNNAGIPVGTTLSSTQEKWRNTGFYSLGVDYKPSKSWTLRGGIGYDMTVIRSARYRTPRIPDGRRFWGSLGLSYAFKNMQLDLGYAHIWVVGGHAKGTDDKNALAGYPNIKYSSQANMLSLGLQYKF